MLAEAIAVVGRLHQPRPTMWLIFIISLVVIFGIKFFNFIFHWKKLGLEYVGFFSHLRGLWYSTSVVTADGLRDMVAKHGRLFGTFRGTTHVLVVSDVEVAKDVMNRQFPNFFKRSFEFQSNDPLWNNAVSNLPYERWKPVRSVMTTCLTSAKMRGMIPKLDKLSNRVVSKLEVVAASEENEITLCSFFRGFAMDSIVAVSFGIEVNCIDDPENPFVKNSSGLFKPGLSLLFVLAPSIARMLPFVHFPPKNVSAFFNKVGRHIIETKRKNLDQVIRDGTADTMDLELIAQRENPDGPLTDEVLLSQAFGFIIAGLDAIVLLLEVLTYLYVANPEAQEKAFHELTRVVGDRNHITYEDLHRLKYLEASVLETSRLYPLAPMVQRTCTRETEVAGIPLRPGDSVDIPLVTLHRDPRYFSRPDDFLPERFMKDGDVSSELTAFLSFGDGPKNCLGKRLALFIIQTVMARMLLSIRLERCDATPVKLRLKPGIRFTDIFEDPLVLKLVPRTRRET